MSKYKQMEHLKRKSIKFLFGLLLLLTGFNLTVSAQLPGRLTGQMTIGDPTTTINGDLWIAPSGELYLGSHSPRGLQTNMLSITGHYAGDAGSKVFISVIDNSNTQNTRGYIDIRGTAKTTGGGTSIILDMFDSDTGWDGTCISLIRADRYGSDVNAFRMDPMPQINGRIAILRYREQDIDLIWYLAEKLIIDQSTEAQAGCLNGVLNALTVTTTYNAKCSYQWYGCDADGSNFVNMGIENGAQTANFTPPSNKEGISYYRCVVTGVTCNYDSDTTTVSGAILVGAAVDILEHPPVKQIALYNDVTLLSIVAEGALNYQWYKNGEKLTGENSASLSIINNSDEVHEYYVEVTGACGDVITSEKVTVGICLPVLVQKRNHTLIVNNNSQNNGGYEFVHFKWYKNDELLHEGFSGDPGSFERGGYYYTGGSNLNPADAYYAVMVASNGKKYQTCEYHPVIKINENITAYPVPVNSSSQYIVTVDAEVNDETMLDNATIDVYSPTGAYVSRHRVTGRFTQINMPNVQGVYMLLFKSSEINKEIKVIVE